MAQQTFTTRVRGFFSTLPLLWKATEATKEASTIGAPYGAGYTVLYTGEKNLGELGPAKVYGVDYNTLRTYGWQHFLESELAHLILKRFCIWIVGSGLKLQANPVGVYLKKNGIEVDKETFNEEIESAFETWSESTASDYANNSNLGALAFEAMKNAIVSGDVLVILRLNKKTLLPTVQLIDGAHVCSPSFGTDYFENTLPNGNVIRNGIESSPTGETVAYHVRKKDFSYERIPAKDSATGLTMAYMVNGLRYRLDNSRCLPLIAAVLETIKKLERYKEATVAQAEEQNKNVFQITQDITSDGTNPLQQRIASAMNPDKTDDLPATAEGRQLADKVAATTNKNAFFMPRGQELKNISAGSGQLYFKDFYLPNAEILCATIGIPPNVALSKYNDSFSASRAATKDWEHTIKIERKKFSDEFYKPIYRLFMHVMVLKSKVNAPGYLLAFYTKDTLVTEAYCSARFSGPMFPHIDPVKEVKAVREMLGPLAQNIPLTTVEKAIDVLGTGLDSDSVAEQFSEELKQAAELGLNLLPTTATPAAAPPPPENEPEDEEEDVS